MMSRISRTATQHEPERGKISIAYIFNALQVAAESVDGTTMIFLTVFLSGLMGLIVTLVSLKILVISCVVLVSGCCLIGRLINKSNGLVSITPASIHRFLTSDEWCLLDVFQFVVRKGTIGFYLSRLCIFLVYGPFTEEELTALLEGCHPRVVQFLTTRGVLKMLPQTIQLVYDRRTNFNEERSPAVFVEEGEDNFNERCREGETLPNILTRDDLSEIQPNTEDDSDKVLLMKEKLEWTKSYSESDLSLDMSEEEEKEGFKGENDSKLKSGTDCENSICVTSVGSSVIYCKASNRNTSSFSSSQQSSQTDQISQQEPADKTAVAIPCHISLSEGATPLVKNRTAPRLSLPIASLSSTNQIDELPVTPQGSRQQFLSASSSTLACHNSSSASSNYLTSPERDNYQQIHSSSSPILSRSNRCINAPCDGGGTGDTNFSEPSSSLSPSSLSEVNKTPRRKSSGMGGIVYGKMYKYLPPSLNHVDILNSPVPSPSSLQPSSIPAAAISVFPSPTISRGQSSCPPRKLKGDSHRHSGQPVKGHKEKYRSQKHDLRDNKLSPANSDPSQQIRDSCESKNLTFPPPETSMLGRVRCVVDSIASVMLTPNRADDNDNGNNDEKMPQQRKSDDWKCDPGIDYRMQRKTTEEGWIACQEWEAEGSGKNILLPLLLRVTAVRLFRNNQYVEGFVKCFKKRMFQISLLVTFWSIARKNRLVQTTAGKLPSFTTIVGAALSLYFWTLLYVFKPKTNLQQSEPHKQLPAPKKEGGAALKRSPSLLDVTQQDWPTCKVIESFVTRFSRENLPRENLKKTEIKKSQRVEATTWRGNSFKRFGEKQVQETPPHMNLVKEEILNFGLRHFMPWKAQEFVEG